MAGCGDICRCSYVSNDGIAIESTGAGSARTVSYCGGVNGCVSAPGFLINELEISGGKMQANLSATPGAMVIDPDGGLYVPGNAGATNCQQVLDQCMPVAFTNGLTWDTATQTFGIEPSNGIVSEDKNTLTADAAGLWAPRPDVWIQTLASDWGPCFQGFSASAYPRMRMLRTGVVQWAGFQFFRISANVGCEIPSGVALQGLRFTGRWSWLRPSASEGIIYDTPDSWGGQYRSQVHITQDGIDFYKSTRNPGPNETMTIHTCFMYR